MATTPSGFYYPVGTDDATNLQAVFQKTAESVEAKALTAANSFSAGNQIILSAGANSRAVRALPAANNNSYLRGDGTWSIDLTDFVVAAPAIASQNSAWPITDIYAVRTLGGRLCHIEFTLTFNSATPGVGDSNTAIGTLPAGFRPRYNVNAQDSRFGMAVRISAAGVMTLRNVSRAPSAGNTTQFTADFISAI